MDARGGEATRLSYHSSNEIPLSFSADGKLIYFDAHRQDAVTNREYRPPHIGCIQYLPVGVEFLRYSVFL